VCRRRLATLKRRGTAEVREIWLRAIDLCELAAGIVADAGAVSDDNARQRLLAGNNHTLNVTAFRSAAPEFVQDSAAELAERFRELDQDEDQR
jgi:hypothetical protein